MGLSSVKVIKVTTALASPLVAKADKAAFDALALVVDTKADDADLSTVAKTGSYGDLSDRPALGTAAAQDSDAFASSAQGAKADSAVQPDALAAAIGTRATAAQGAKADSALQPEQLADREDVGAGFSDEKLVTPYALEARFQLPALPMETGYVATQRPLLTVYGSNDLYVPIQFILPTVPRQGLNTGVMPLNTESAEIPGYAKIAAPSAASLVFFDFDEKLYKIATYPTAPTAARGYIPVASWWNGRWAPYEGVTIEEWEDGRFFKESQFTRGNDPDFAQVFSANTTRVDVTDPILTAMGITRGWSGTSAYMGEELPDGMPKKGFYFGRVYLQASADNEWKTQYLYLLSRSGATLGSYAMTLERRYSARVASFTVSGAYNFAEAPKKANIGTAQTATNPVIVAGGQFAVDARRFRIPLASWPESRDLVPIYGPDAFFAAGRQKTFYLDNLFSDRAQPSPIVSLASTKGAPLQAIDKMGAGGQLTIDPALVGADLTIRRVPQFERSVINEKTVKTYVLPAPLAGVSKRVLFMGDSITNRQTGLFVSQILASLGVTMTGVGTMNGAGSLIATSTSGPLGEAREGWATTDFLGINLADGDVPLGVLPVGQESAYLAGTKTSKLGYNVFLNQNTAAGSQAPIVNVGGTNYRFDMRFYLDRFTLADPDIVVLNLGMNDLLEGTAATFIANITSIVAEFRRALPSAQILLWLTTMPYGLSQEALNRNSWSKMQRQLVELVESLRVTDSRIYLASVWSHQSPMAGWPLTTLATDASKVRNSLISDGVHPNGAARDQQTDELATAIACLSAL